MSEDTTKAIEQTENSQYCTSLLLFTILSTIPMINYGLTCLNPVLPVMEEMYNESHVVRYGEPMSSNKWEMLKALTMSMIVAGAFFGCFLLKAFMLCLSRRKCMLAVHYINLIGGAITCATAGLTRAYEAIIVGRFITGIASGMALGLVPVVVGETCVKHRRPVYDGLIGVSLAVGSLLGVFFGWPRIFGTIYLWPLVPLLPVIPSLIYILLSLPETPYQVLKTGKKTELRKLIRKLRGGSEEAVDEEIRQLIGDSRKSEALMEIDFNESPMKLSIHRDITLKEAIGVKQYRRQFVMVMILFASLMFNGLNNVLFYSDAIFMEAGFDPSFVTVATICVFLFQVIATLPGSILLHRIGSWMLLIMGNIIMIIGHILIVVSLTLVQSSPGVSCLAPIGMAVYFFGFSGCANVAIFPLISEITIEKTRPICLNFGSATLWFTGWLVGFSAVYFEIWLGPNSFLIWTALTIGFTIYTMILVPNTKNRSSAEIQMRFKMD